MCVNLSPELVRCVLICPLPFKRIVSLFNYAVDADFNWRDYFLLKCLTLWNHLSLPKKTVIKLTNKDGPCRPCEPSVAMPPSFVPFTMINLSICPPESSVPFFSISMPVAVIKVARRIHLDSLPFPFASIPNSGIYAFTIVSLLGIQSTSTENPVFKLSIVKRSILQTQQAFSFRHPTLHVSYITVAISPHDPAKSVLSIFSLSRIRPRFAFCKPPQGVRRQTVRRDWRLGCLVRNFVCILAAAKWKGKLSFFSPQHFLWSFTFVMAHFIFVLCFRGRLNVYSSRCPFLVPFIMISCSCNRILPLHFLPSALAASSCSCFVNVGTNGAIPLNCARNGRSF
mmetsp:Transcript_41361/g.107118  ORF Transcript_41361/g.107118 Transcript_41361/m.107118 type:complete len:340 (-) Transcript_41361:1022-2041(-)